MTPGTRNRGVPGDGNDLPLYGKLALLAASADNHSTVSPVMPVSLLCETRNELPMNMPSGYQQAIAVRKHAWGELPVSGRDFSPCIPCEEMSFARVREERSSARAMNHRSAAMRSSYTAMATGAPSRADS